VLGYAVIAGITIVGFTKLAEFFFNGFLTLQGRYSWAPLLWTPLCTVVIVFLTRKFAAGSAGSGIPQVIAALDPKCKYEERGLFVSLKLSFFKIILTAAGLLAGLSLGREGPSVQIAAGIMRNAKRWLPSAANITETSLIMAGGAAGIAAAFNTPLGGVMFAIEELSKSLEQRSNGLMIASIVLAGLVGISITGNYTYFGVIHTSEFSLKIILPCILVILVSGILGGGFSKILIVSLRANKSRLGKFRANSPLIFAGICGLLVALIGITSNGETYGTGYAHTQSIISGSESASYLFVPLKFIATWLSTWSGVPAGIFAPSLAIGAGIGDAISTALALPNAQILIAIGMAGFLAAVTQAPMTSFIIVMEMVDGHGLVLSLMASALIAGGISKMINRPLYPSLARMQLSRLLPK
jgi:H+/Cl- antiporter ClcA